MGLVGESLRTKNHGPKNHIRVGKSGSQGRKIKRNATTQNGPNTLEKKRSDQIFFFYQIFFFKIRPLKFVEVVNTAF